MHFRTSVLGAASVFALAAATHASVIRVTEVMSKSGADDPTRDWFEITNYGSSAVDLTGWKMDDNSFSFAAGAVLQGIGSIAAGETVLLVEVSRNDTAEEQAQEIVDFRAFWGGLAGVRIGTYAASGVSFSSGGDALALYNAAGTEMTRVSFGAATSARSFYWGWDALGSVLPAYNGLVSSVGTLDGQVTFLSVGAGEDGVNVGSLGTAIIPTPGPVALLALAGVMARRRK